MPTQIAFVAPTQPGRTELMVEMAAAHPQLKLDIVPHDLPKEEQIARLSPHEIMILGSRITMEVLAACPRVKFIQLMSAGYDTFSIPALTARGIQFANSSAAISTAVAEHAITLMLAVKRRLVESWKSVQERRWAGDVAVEAFTELSGSTIGVIGLGHIGREVAKRLSGWDVDLLYYDACAAPKSDSVPSEGASRRCSRRRTWSHSTCP